MTWRATLLLAGLLVFAPARFASLAQSPSARATPDAGRATSVLDHRTREVASELRCPVCQGESIQESPSPLAQEMKGVVREQLAAGKTPDEVKAYFVARYGEWILLRPSADGVNVLLYWLPPLVLVAGIAVVLIVARRWTRAGAAVRPAPTTPANDA